MLKVVAFYLQTEASTEKHLIHTPLLIPRLDDLHSPSKCALKHPKLAPLSLTHKWIHMIRVSHRGLG